VLDGVRPDGGHTCARRSKFDTGPFPRTPPISI